MEKDRYKPHFIQLDDTYYIESTNHNSYILREKKHIKSGPNKGEANPKDLAYGDIPHLIKRYVEQLMHDNHADQTITLEQYIKDYKDITNKILEMMED